MLFSFTSLEDWKLYNNIAMPITVNILFWYDGIDNLTMMCIRVSLAPILFLHLVLKLKKTYIIAAIDSLLLNSLSGAVSKYLNNEVVFIPF